MLSNQSVFNNQKLQEETECSITQDDYQIRQRNSDQSIKYSMTLNSKQVYILNPEFPLEALQNRPIVCSNADMQFRFPKYILQDVNQRVENMPVQFGYTKPTEKQKQILIQWIKKRYYSKLNPQIIDINGGLTSLYFGIITNLIQENDQVLIFSPVYNRFIITVKQTKRRPVQYLLKTRNTEQGPQFYIDFQQLQKVFSESKIKLVVWVNPFNPTGRIWTKQQSEKLVKLVLKYDCMIFADQIYADSVLNVDNFTSILNFEQIHEKLIWGGAFTKTFNCSGSPIGHTYIPNQKIREKVHWYMKYAHTLPNSFQIKLMTSCYTLGQQWRVNTMKYIMKNYNFLKKQCKQKLPKLIIYKLDCTYLMMVDFKNYGMCQINIQQMMNKINVFPTYFVQWFMNPNLNQISICRINLAINIKVLEQLINRLSKALNNKI